MNTSSLTPHFLKALTFSSPLLLGTLAQASMIFVDTPSAFYAAGTTATAMGNPTNAVGTGYGPSMGTYENITMDLTSDVDGTWDVNNNHFRYELSNDLVTGETVCLTVSANMQLFSGAPADGSGNRRGAFYVRVNNNDETTTTLDGSSMLTMTGGTNTLLSYVPTVPAIGAVTYNNGLNSFDYNPAIGSLAGVQGSTQFNGFTGTDTMNFLTGPDIDGQNGTTTPNHYSVVARDPHQNTTDFNWQTFTFHYTNTSTDPLVAGTHFRFTVDGVNPVAQALLAAVPEPSRALLLGLGFISLLLRRRR